MDNSFMRYESVDILDLKELLMPRVVSECIPDKHFGNELMVPIPFMEDYFENKEYYENDFFFELPDSVVLNGSQFMGIGVAPYNFILLMKWPDKDCVSGYHFRARGFYTYVELSCYIDRCAPVSFVYWIYVKDIDSYTEVQYHIIRSHDGNFERAVIPCLAEFPKQELDLSGTDITEYLRYNSTLTEEFILLKPIAKSKISPLQAAYL